MVVRGRQFVSYRDILALDDIDAVMIASCDHHHAAHLEAAAKVKKDAYCEKPLAMDMESLKRCCDEVKKSGIVVQMGTQVRSYETSTGCRELFRSGAIGKVSRIEQCRNGSKPYWYSWMQRAEPIKKEDVDWKEFLMDRPMRPFDGKLLTGWYGYRDFTDGPIANPGVPLLRPLQLHRWEFDTGKLRRPRGHVHLERRVRLHLSRPMPGRLHVSRRVHGQLLDQFR